MDEIPVVPGSIRNRRGVWRHELQVDAHVDQVRQGPSRYVIRSRRLELSRSLLNLAECGGKASYPQFTAVRGIPT
jgi:hypothetical protein